MKRRVNTLASTTTTKKRRDWKEAEEEEDGAEAGPLPDSDDEPKAENSKPEEKTAAKAATGIPNPVVWFEISVADKPRGRLHFELFRDLLPVAAENFRKLCAGYADDGGKKISYAKTFFDLVHTKTVATGGDIDASVQLEGIEQSGPLRHAKAGLLTMPIGNLSSFDPRFQITLGPTPNLDGKQVIFGQLLASPGAALHPLHWVEAVSTSTGTPREEVQVEACGECTTEECQVLLGAMVMAAQVDRTSESQADRYGRSGLLHGELEDAVTSDNLSQVLELTEDLLGHLEWACKRTMADSERDRKAGLLEVKLKSLMAALRKVAFKAGEVNGFENRLALDAKGQLGRAKDLEQSLLRVY
ncbi:cyp12 [Symbiodinium natans]|uniref:Cyp12 protein n=1 Tax=Symbiodinium natans TaxID=878477 RepID=A0A812IH28_9DINO|nr:cyp12 [Symbiodinium natans]